MLSFVFFGIIFSACKRSSEEDNDFIGPVDTTTPLNFKVLGDSLHCRYDLVNFQISKQFFLASFSHKVSWSLLVKGENSGAIRSFYGLSDRLDSTNTRFQGDADSIQLFTAAEKCNATLTIVGWSKSYQTSFSINGTKKFNCLILDDFEKTISDTGFVDNYSDADDSLVSFKRGISDTIFEGKYAAKLSGYDVNKNYWLAALGSQNVKFSSLLSGNNPSSTYLNLFALGQQKGSTVIEIQLMEDENGNGTFENTIDEVWSKQVRLKKKWTQFSLLYDDFSKTASVGNGIKETSKLLKINFVIICNPPGGYGEAYLDFVNFTFNKPFSQK